MNTLSLISSSNQIGQDLRSLALQTEDKTLRSQLQELVDKQLAITELSLFVSTARCLLEKVKVASPDLLPQIEAIERAIAMQFPQKAVEDSAIQQILVESCIAFTRQLLKNCSEQSDVVRKITALGLGNYFRQENQKVLGASMRLLFKRGLPSNEKSILRKILSFKFPLEPALQRYTLCYTPEYFFIGLKGVEVLAEHLRKKGALKLASTSCTAAEFANALEKQLQSESLPHLFFVAVEEGRAHIATCMLQKDARGKRQLVWADSLGGLGAMNMMFEVRKIQKLHDIKLYRLFDQRQKDPDGCAVFALHDAIQLCQNKERFQHLHKEAAFQAPYKFVQPLLSGDFTQLDSNAKPVYPLVGVPIGFWLPTQSFAELDAILEGKTSIERQLQKIKTELEALQKEQAALQQSALPEDEKTEQAIKLANQVDTLKERQASLDEKLDKVAQIDYFAPTKEEREKFEKRLSRYAREVESPTASGEKLLKKQNHFVASQKDKYEGILWEYEILRSRV